MSAIKGMRLKEPIEDIQIDDPDALTFCTHCGARTHVLSSDGIQHLEQCGECGQRFNVTESIIDEETGEAVPAEASQQDLDRLFGNKPSPYPDFGSF